MNIFAKRTNNANNAIHDVKLGASEKRQKNSIRNYNFIGPRVMIKAIIIILKFKFCYDS